MILVSAYFVWYMGAMSTLPKTQLRTASVYCFCYYHFLRGNFVMDHLDICHLPQITRNCCIFLRALASCMAYGESSTYWISKIDSGMHEGSVYDIIAQLMHLKFKNDFYYFLPYFHDAYNFLFF